MIAIQAANVHVTAQRTARNYMTFAISGRLSDACAGLLLTLVALAFDGMQNNSAR